jgi:hypothetical protein
MDVGFVGDSWTVGFGVDEGSAFPYLMKKNTDLNIISNGVCDGGNSVILNEGLKLINEKQIEMLIVGWSGISRINLTTKQGMFEQDFSLSYDPKRDTEIRGGYFKSIDYPVLVSKWNKQISTLVSVCNEQNIKLTMFTVFGEKPKINKDYFVNESFLVYLAKKQGNEFHYDIPCFEFDFLHEKNLVGREFCDRNFNNDWKLACAEREEIRPGKYFLHCGHPNKEGHKLWAKHLLNHIKVKKKLI